jgi:hypothetical protein
VHPWPYRAQLLELVHAEQRDRDRRHALRNDAALGRDSGEPAAPSQPQCPLVPSHKGHGVSGCLQAPARAPPAPADGGEWGAGECLGGADTPVQREQDVRQSAERVSMEHAEEAAPGLDGGAPWAREAQECVREGAHTGAPHEEVDSDSTFSGGGPRCEVFTDEEGSGDVPWFHDAGSAQGGGLPGDSGSTPAREYAEAPGPTADDGAGGTCSGGPSSPTKQATLLELAGANHPEPHMPHYSEPYNRFRLCPGDDDPLGAPFHTCVDGKSGTVVLPVKFGSVCFAALMSRNRQRTATCTHAYAAVLPEENCTPDEGGPGPAACKVPSQAQKLVESADLPLWECDTAEKCKVTVAQVRRRHCAHG